MENTTYEMYKNLGWTPQEIWEFASETEHCNDGVEEDE